MRYLPESTFRSNFSCISYISSLTGFNINENTVYMDLESRLPPCLRSFLKLYTFISFPLIILAWISSWRKLPPKKSSVILPSFCHETFFHTFPTVSSFSFSENCSYKLLLGPWVHQNVSCAVVLVWCHSLVPHPQDSLTFLVNFNNYIFHF